MMEMGALMAGRRESAGGAGGERERPEVELDASTPVKTRQARPQAASAGGSGSRYGVSTGRW